MRRTEIFIFRAKIVIAFLKHQHLPFFVLCVGQTAVSSYYLRDLYGELLLHSSCLPFHAEFISLKLIRSLKQYNWSSLLHTIPSSPFINSILRGRAVYLFASRAHEPLCIVLIPSRFCWHHPVHIATTSRIITHRDSTITINLLPHLGRSASTYYRSAIWFAISRDIAGIVLSSLVQRQFTFRAPPFEHSNFIVLRPS